MFYARCAKAAMDARRIGYRNPFNFWLRDLVDPLEAIDSHYRLCLSGDGELGGEPLFPVGQLDVPPWLLQDLALYWDEVQIVD
jgi:hypothetical protein